ncbi:hypothetical protein ACFOG5_09080 [Pedobacter fastidiosus]|uniref:hypothetical protein n=1 Tax=Pedobacter fastidiosus TaxID=2765361 RepID=UPI00164E7E7D|nr:hypothetical protein [Pedobacter fastidiosus]
MLVILLFSYLIRSGKLKRQVQLVKSFPKRIALKLYRPETAIISGIILTGYNGIELG